MNILVPLLDDHYDILPPLEEEGEIPFVPDVAGRAFAELDRGGLDRGGLVEGLISDMFAAEIAGRSFLPVVHVDTWEAAVEEALSAGPPLAAEEWVDFVPDRRSDFGVTLPNDAAPDVHVGVFAYLGDVARRVSFGLGLGRTPAVSVPLMVRPCGDYIGRQCTSVDCSGPCRPRLVERGRVGTICVCEPATRGGRPGGDTGESGLGRR